MSQITQVVVSSEVVCSIADLISQSIELVFSVTIDREMHDEQRTYMLSILRSIDTCVCYQENSLAIQYVRLHLSAV